MFYVVCCNDSIEFVGTTEAIAEEKLQELKLRYYDNNRQAFDNYPDYLRRCHWHIHTVEGK